MTRAVEASVYRQLRDEVIAAGLCTHCGACAGLSRGTVRMEARGDGGPIPVPATERTAVPPEALAACPGRGVNYPQLQRQVFGALPGNWLAGHCRACYVGYAGSEDVRRAGASGGIITQALLYLLDTGRVQGVVAVRQGTPRPWQAEAVIARSPAEVRACAQSVYVPVPVNALLDQISAFEGRLAYVGLPDQVAALRTLQGQGHPGAGKVDFVLGPYTGTLMYEAALASYLRANGVDDLREVVSLQYRAGAWPGHLRVVLRAGRVLTAEKFYYNYLIPFYITQSTLLSVDFTNELTDLSVGDAWHPAYEAKGGGYSVMMVRSEQGAALVDAMRADGLLVLDELPLDEALAMHGHMLDFKKRGGFLRAARRRRKGLPAPSFGYAPLDIGAGRRAVESVLALLFGLCRRPAARWLAEHIPLRVMGPLFNALRKSWKAVSKPAKRKGLHAQRYGVVSYP